MDHSPDEMTVSDMAATLRRRWWIIVGSVLLTTAVAVVVASLQTPIYEAEARMLVQTRSTDSLFESGVDLRGQDATRAVQTEIEVLEGDFVAERVRVNADLDDLPSVEGTVVGSTDVVSVKVRSTDPATAQTLANAYVRAYVDVRREQGVEELLAASSVVQDKITELQIQIEDLPADDTQRVALLNQQAAFRQTLDQLQVDAALKTGGASVVKPAELPESPVEPTPLRDAALALTVGLLIGLALAFAVDHFDDSIRTAEELERVSPLPVLAVVPVDAPLDNRPVALSAPTDFAVEVYRGLRTNVQFLGLDRPMRVLQVTSALPGEGKTTTATNLGVVLAQAGKRVAIVDADLRRPRVHEVFATPLQPGLTDVLVDEPLSLVTNLLQIDGGNDITILSAGNVPGNPSELLSSERCRSLIAELSAQFDHVIVDSAPVLPVADAIALSGAVDAVLFVTQAKRTSSRVVAEALERLYRVNAPVVGLVLNQATRGNGSYAHGYGYSYAPSRGLDVDGRQFDSTVQHEPPLPSPVD